MSSSQGIPPPQSYRPMNITNRPDTFNGTIYVETAMPPPKADNQPNPDVAGVLRRNQACLSCRRRKLKCDAVCLPAKSSEDRLDHIVLHV
jgi:hypothetical protein